ncbi:hypothetical protein LO763_22760 [Glycomyces sp. A-F 0318]|uniref:hypothetical protein n=1 Tax=Glycomyces amatae TaxID=2881355 RepID=UPI001E5CDF6F|nr:hypothetical protein [Glycomyces amatae]MCD0446441.1 hypothetical protein [Glycomyces amatae]
MTDATFTVLTDAVAARNERWPDAEPLPALSTYLGIDARLDRATGTLVTLNDMSHGAQQSDREPDIYLTGIAGHEWMTDPNFTDLLADRAETWGIDPAETQSLRTALDELTNVHAASLRAIGRAIETQEATARHLGQHERKLQAELAVTRMLRGHLMRAMVDATPVTADIDLLELVKLFPVESFDELVTLVNEHRRLMGEVA